MKIVRADVASNPIYSDAVRFGKQFTQTTSDQNQLMASLNISLILNSPEYNEDAFRVSCDWLHTNVNLWKGWITNTPLPPIQYKECGRGK